MLLNVAGIDYEGPFDERRVDELHTIIRLNIEATVAMTRCILEFRDPARTLRIVNVSSLAGYVPMPIKAVYAASKRFLLDFSLALHQELRAADVTVTALCPAGMPTNASNIRGIAVQGFMGQITTVNVGDVAAQTIDCALAGRTVVIPGALNRALRVVGGLLPASLMAGLLNKRWRQARQTATEHATVAPSQLVA
jgi:short-subunit dehydrogenase